MADVEHQGHAAKGGAVASSDRHLPVPTSDDIERVHGLLRSIGGANVTWGAHQVMEVLLVEHRMRSEQVASDRLMRATWVLAAATIVLAVATIALIFVTAAQ